MRRGLTFPEGKRFAFTVIDDTDVATVANVKPVYDVLYSLGMRTTKTVWPLPCADTASSFISSETLADRHYLDFILELKSRGFEITWHAATMESSRRPDTLRGLEEFRRLIGCYPRIHVNHANNRENVYWGLDRLDSPLVRALVRRAARIHPGEYVGHVPGSEYWWGDAAAKYMEYGRNLTFNRINLATINPTMPYRDPRRPLIARWFSASDAEDVTEFNRLLRPPSIERLEAEGGFCIVATHFGKGFAQHGRMNAQARAALERLAARDGWFPTVGELLDWLGTQQSDELPEPEWQRMQLRWLSDLISRKLMSGLQRRLLRFRHDGMDSSTGDALDAAAS